jgi:hypothetical protein
MAVFFIVPKIAAKSWVSGSARVLSASMYQRTGKTHDWCAQIRFEYAVNGKVYRNAQFSSGLVSDAACRKEKARTESFLRGVAPGTGIQIFYDPDAPEKSAIVRENLHWLEYFLLIASLALFGAAIHAIRLGRVILRQRAH